MVAKASEPAPSIAAKRPDLPPSLVTRLHLQHASVSDAGMQLLGRLPSLTDLNLNYTQVGDEGLELLANLPSLTAVDLKGTDVSTEGRRILEDARPGIHLAM